MFKYDFGGWRGVKIQINTGPVSKIMKAFMASDVQPGISAFSLGKCALPDLVTTTADIKVEI